MDRKELRYKLIILKTIKDNKKINSVRILRKQIVKRIFMRGKELHNLLAGLVKLVNELESEKWLLRSGKGYTLTKKGYFILDKYQKDILKALQTQNLEIWTVEDLQKYNTI
ncbi:MAG: hypothetical protein ACFE9R_06910 [Candidatus Hermodarchaeota archaeon]